MEEAHALPALLRAPQTLFKGCIFQMTKHTVMCLGVSQHTSQAVVALTRFSQQNPILLDILLIFTEQVQDSKV